MASAFDELMNKNQKSLKEKVEQMLACFYSPQARVSFRNQIKEDINTLISKTEEQLEETKTKYALLEKQQGCEDSQNITDKDIEHRFHESMLKLLKSNINNYEDLLRSLEELKQNPYAPPANKFATMLKNITTRNIPYSQFPSFKELEKRLNSPFKI